MTIVIDVIDNKFELTIDTEEVRTQTTKASKKLILKVVEAYLDGQESQVESEHLKKSITFGNRIADLCGEMSDHFNEKEFCENNRRMIIDYRTGPAPSRGEFIGLMNGFYVYASAEGRDYKPLGNDD